MKIKKIVFIVLVIALTAIFSTQVWAKDFSLNVKVEGGNIIMESETTDMDWSLNSFLPGQSDTSTVTINNTGNQNVDVETSIGIEEDTGLLEMIDLTVKDKSGNTVYDGTYTDFNSVTKSIAPGENETYTVATTLNLNAGNEYQGKQYNLKFDFIASTDIQYGTLTVRYVDENGVDIEPPTVETRPTTETYRLPETGKDFKDQGYEFTGKVDGSLTGTYSIRGTEVVYHYKKVAEGTKKFGRVIVVCIDENNTVIKRTIRTEEVGKDYNLEKVGEEIPGYEFLGVEGETSGKYKEEDTIVTYRYKSIKKGTTTNTITKPKTGDKVIKYIAIAIGAVIVLAIVIIITKKKDK